MGTAGITNHGGQFWEILDSLICLRATVCPYLHLPVIPFRPHMGSTPKMDFPKFDGEDHQVWLDNCELYFEILGFLST